MEELKQLVEMVANLPQLALWVAIGFWMYKVLIIGSIYGVIRLAITKTHDVLTARRVKEIDLRGKFAEMCITSDGTHEFLIDQLMRLRRIHDGADKTFNYKYIHRTDVLWLKDAIDEKLARDEQAKKDAQK